MKRYEKYKDSEVAWLGQVPEHWGRERIKHCFDERVQKGYPDELLLSATQSHGVIPQSLYANRVVSAQKDLHLLKLVEKGDFVISLRSFQGGIEFAYYRGIISPAYTVMAPKTISDGYFRYLAKSADFIGLLQTCVTGIREGQNIDYRILKNKRIPIPMPAEQEQIVRYLDWKVAMADKFVREKKREIALLRELRQAEINQAVTRGLDPNAPTRPSGIGWIGEIPKHWKVRNFNHHFLFGKGLPITKKDLTEYGIEVISYGQIHSKLNNSIGLNKELVRYVSPSYLDTNTQSLLKKGDFVFADTSEDQEGSGNNIYIDTENLIFAGYHTVITRPVNIDNCEYVAYLFQSECWKRQIRSAINGVKVFSITKSILRKTKILFPTPLEQQQIVAHIQTVEERINKAIEDIEKQIRLVAEYKTSLVSDVTTGKVDVRAIEIPDYQKEEPTTTEEDQTEDNNE